MAFGGGTKSITSNVEAFEKLATENYRRELPENLAANEEKSKTDNQNKPESISEKKVSKPESKATKEEKKPAKKTENKEAKEEKKKPVPKEGSENNAKLPVFHENMHINFSKDKKEKFVGIRVSQKEYEWLVATAEKYMGGKINRVMTELILSEMNLEEEHNNS